MLILVHSVLQRGDYQELLVQAALRLGVKIMVGANVIGIESKDDGKEVVQLKDGTTVEGDVVIGADGKFAVSLPLRVVWLTRFRLNLGLWSTTRNLIFSKPINPRKLGHVAFRATFSRDDVKGLQSERLERMMEQADTQVWLGFGKHVVFYPLRNHEQFNLVFMFVTLNRSNSVHDLTDGTTVSQTKVQHKCLNPSTRYKN